MIQTKQRPQKSVERGGVVVVGDAEVEVAEQVLVHEVEPEPAANVAVGGEWDLPVAPKPLAFQTKWNGAGWPCVGLARPARMCHGAAMARKIRSEVRGWSWRMRVRVPRGPRVRRR